MGRATPQGVLVMADGKVLKNEDAAVSRMDKLLGLELAGGLQYTYELAPESNLGPTIDEMRRELEQEAAANGLPIRAWK
jgi:preprotein translocase subunit SecD